MFLTDASTRQIDADLLHGEHGRSYTVGVEIKWTRGELYTNLDKTVKFDSFVVV